jgi:hypothetical protein
LELPKVLLGGKEIAQVESQNKWRTQNTGNGRYRAHFRITCAERRTVNKMQKFIPDAESKSSLPEIIQSKHCYAYPVLC